MARRRTHRGRRSRHRARDARSKPGQNGLALVQAIPTTDPSASATGATIDRLRSELPVGVLVGGAAAENHDLAASLSTYTPIVIGVILVLGFVLLLVALQAPVVAAIGVLTNLLATGAAFGVARLVFQNGDLAGVLGFQSQGFLDAWGPVFFFAMIFAISMDYTVFLLSSAKEHWDHSHDAHDAAIGGMAHSGRVILAAGRGHGRGVLHLRALGPPPPEGDGDHPRGRGRARRPAGPAAAGASRAAPRRPLGLVAPAVAAPRPPGGAVWALAQRRSAHHRRVGVVTPTRTTSRHESRESGS